MKKASLPSTRRTGESKEANGGAGYCAKLEPNINLLSKRKGYN